jgi:hypothetical protein
MLMSVEDVFSPEAMQVTYTPGSHQGAFINADPDTRPSLSFCLEVQMPEDKGEGLYYSVGTNDFDRGRSILLIPPQGSLLHLLSDLSDTNKTVIEWLKTGQRIGKSRVVQ